MILGMTYAMAVSEDSSFKVVRTDRHLHPQLKKRSTITWNFLCVFTLTTKETLLFLVFTIWAFNVAFQLITVASGKIACLVGVEMT